MAELSLLNESLKRAVAVPGTFATVFPDTADTDIEALLADAVAEAQLDGFLAALTLNVDDNEVDPDLTPAQGALVVIYAGYRMLTNEIRNRKSHVRYEAGPTVFEQDQEGSTLNELLRQINERKRFLLERAERGELDDSGAFVGDLAFIKATSDYGWYSDLTLYEYQGL